MTIETIGANKYKDPEGFKPIKLKNADVDKNLNQY